ncbi:MAG: DHH family phosphoesterase [Candidatus Cloacimonetes bacterium]|nr:DHH family phosphoesterase [Candidatus Cloacimonadota bacterium]MDY0171525.1 DHH family phosphoesterase [Candidatus Cloacimonadaceae bacterium]
MTKDISNKLFALAHGAKSIAITTHIHSDGDGMVAAFAFQEILRVKGLASVIITDGEDLSRYSFLMDNAVHQAYQEGMKYELLIVLDCNGRDRLGQRAALVDAAQKVFVLDHHVPEHGVIKADLQVVDSHYVSAGAMLYRLFEQEIMSFEPEVRKFIADAVYVTILNDTNNFSNANTNAQVFELCADLTKQGAQPHFLNQAFLQNQSAQEMLYIGHSLASISLHLDKRILFLHSDIALARELNYDPASAMSVSRYVQGVANVQAIAYFQEIGKDLWKISLRSLKLNVQEIAAIHGGGGHRKASGLTLKGNLQDVQKIVLEDISQALKQL